MNCPECGKLHQKNKRPLEICKSRVTNEYGHLIILCFNMPGGVCKENLEKYGHLNISYTLNLISRWENMNKYYATIVKGDLDE